MQAIGSAPPKVNMPSEIRHTRKRIRALATFRSEWPVSQKKTQDFRIRERCASRFVLHPNSDEFGDVKYELRMKVVVLRDGAHLKDFSDRNVFAEMPFGILRILGMLLLRSKAELGTLAHFVS